MYAYIDSEVQHKIILKEIFKMKKTRKNHHAGRITSLLIVLCMVLSIVPITAYTDGECSANFEVKKATAEPSKPEKSPQTSDNSNMFLWVALLFISGAGVAGIMVYSKRKKYAE